MKLSEKITTNHHLPNPDATAGGTEDTIDNKTTILDGHTIAGIRYIEA